MRRVTSWSPTLRVREGPREQVKRRPSRTFTVSLGIFLLEASLRGQSSSEERAERAFHLTSSLEPPNPH